MLGIQVGRRLCMKVCRRSGTGLVELLVGG